MEILPKMLAVMTFCYGSLFSGKSSQRIKLTSFNAASLNEL